MNVLYDLVTINKLQKWTDKKSLYHSRSIIDWKKLISNYLGIDEEALKDDTPVAITNWDYLNQLMSLIDKTSPTVLGTSDIFFFLYYIVV